MAARGTRAGPAKKRGTGSNIDEVLAGQKLLENIRLHKLRDATFKTKQKENWEKNVAAIAKKLNMPMGDVKAFYEDHAIETGKDEDAAEKAARRRARRLNTYSRLYSFTHDGSQLDWLDIQKKDDEAIKAAEEEAASAEEEDDSAAE